MCNGASTGCTQQDIWIGTGGVQSMSPDGRYRTLLANDGQVYVQDTCIGTRGECVPSTTIASVADDGTPANFYCNFSWITANGRFLLFSTDASNLVPNDTNGNDSGGEDMFVHDTCIGAVGVCTPQTVRISLAADGSQAEQPLDPYVVMRTGAMPLLLVRLSWFPV
jgi:hypothetical protein